MSLMLAWPVCAGTCVGSARSSTAALSRRPDAANNRLAAGCPAVPDDPQADDLKLAVCHVWKRDGGPDFVVARSDW